MSFALVSPSQRRRDLLMFTDPGRFTQIPVSVFDNNKVSRLKEFDLPGSGGSLLDKIHDGVFTPVSHGLEERETSLTPPGSGSNLDYLSTTGSYQESRSLQKTLHHSLLNDGLSTDYTGHQQTQNTNSVFGEETEYVADGIEPYSIEETRAKMRGSRFKEKKNKRSDISFPPETFMFSPRINVFDSSDLAVYNKEVFKPTGKSTAGRWKTLSKKGIKIQKGHKVRHTPIYLKLFMIF